nr:hypothetical protein [Tanacetum cinerariifolium]
MSSSIVTYTSVYTDSEPRRVYWGVDKDLSDGEPKHPPSPNYVPGLEHPPSPVEVPYPLPVDALPITLSASYVACFDLDEDPEEDPKEDHADYPADGGDDNDDPSDDNDDDDDDDDTDDEDDEPSKDEDDD